MATELHPPAGRRAVSAVDDRIKTWLCRRIDAILDRLEGAGQPPSTLDVDGVRRAIAHAEAGEFALANRALNDLQRLAPVALRRPHDLRPVDDGATTATLRARLDAICS